MARMKEAKKSEEAPRNAVGPSQPFNSVLSYAYGYRLFAKMIKMPAQNETRKTARNRLLKKR